MTPECPSVCQSHKQSNCSTLPLPVPWSPGDGKPPTCPILLHCPHGVGLMSSGPLFTEHSDRLLMTEKLLHASLPSLDKVRSRGRVPCWERIQDKKADGLWDTLCPFSVGKEAFGTSEPLGDVFPLHGLMLPPSFFQVSVQKPPVGTRL